MIGAYLPLKSYNYPVYDNMNAVSHNARLIANWINHNYPSDVTKHLLCRGSSGLTIATMVWSLVENCEIMFCRKEPSHDVSKGFSYNAIRKIELDDVLIIVDDFIATGETVETIVDEYVETWQEYYANADMKNLPVKHIDAMIVLTTMYKLQRLRLTKIPIYVDRIVSCLDELRDAEQIVWEEASERTGFFPF